MSKFHMQVVFWFMVVLMMGLAVSMAHSMPGFHTTTRLHKVSGPGPRIVRIRESCMGAEDSAAHLHLVSYGPHVAVYNCPSRGY